MRPTGNGAPRPEKVEVMSLLLADRSLIDRNPLLSEVQQLSIILNPHTTEIPPQLQIQPPSLSLRQAGLIVVRYV